MLPHKALWLICALVVAVEPPDGCASSSWTFSCSGGATCESLAIAGLTCSSVALIENCKDACAEPCCITTTSTTLSSTMTSVTHTETTLTVTLTQTTSTTATVTHTETMTTTTETTNTQTYTGSMTYTHTETHTHTGTTTMTTVATTSAEVAAAKITVTMAVKVEGNAEAYMEDSRVKKAYMDLMQDVTGLDAGMIDVSMAPTDEEGEISVAYLLTVPYEDKGNGLEPVVSLESLQNKLAQLDMAGLNEMLDQKMEAAGVTDFSQEVQKVDDDQTVAINGTPRLCLGTLGTLGMATTLTALFCTF